MGKKINDLNKKCDIAKQGKRLTSKINISFIIKHFYLKKISNKDRTEYSHVKVLGWITMLITFKHIYIYETVLGVQRARAESS